MLIIAPAWGTCTQAQVTATFIKTPFAEALATLSSQTQCSITVPEDWNKQPVTAVFHETSLQDALDRLIRSAGIKNFVTIVDPLENVLTVRIFDSAPSQNTPQQRPKPRTHSSDMFPPLN